MKKLMKLFLIFGLSVSMIGCSSSSDESDTDTYNDTNISESGTYYSFEGVYATGLANDLSDVILCDEDEMDLDLTFVDNDNYSIKAIQLEIDEHASYELTLEIENKTDQEIRFSGYVAFNDLDGYTSSMDGFLKETISANSTDEEDVTLTYDGTFLSLEEITKICLILNTYDTENYTFFEQNIEYIIYPYGEDEAQSYSRSTTVDEIEVLDNGSFKATVVSISYYEADDIDASQDMIEVMFYLENSYDVRIDFYMTNLSLDDSLDNSTFSFREMGTATNHSNYLALDINIIEDSGITSLSNINEITFDYELNLSGDTTDYDAGSITIDLSEI